MRFGLNNYRIRYFIQPKEHAHTLWFKLLRDTVLYPAKARKRRELAARHDNSVVTRRASGGKGNRHANNTFDAIYERFRVRGKI